MCQHYYSSLIIREWFACFKKDDQEHQEATKRKSYELAISVEKEYWSPPSKKNEFFNEAQAGYFFWWL